MGCMYEVQSKSVAASARLRKIVFSLEITNWLLLISEIISPVCKYSSGLIRTKTFSLFSWRASRV